MNLHDYIAGSPPGLLPLSRTHRVRIGLLAIAAFFLFAGCGDTPPPGPGAEAVAHSYLAALKAGDYQTCYRMLTESDLAHGSLGGFLDEVPMAPEVDRHWFAQIEAATQYSVGSASERGGEVILPVNVITPDLVLWEHTLAASRDTRQTVRSKAEKQLADGSYPRLNYSDQIVMVREGEGWRLLAGVAQRARIDRLHDQALNAYHQLEYEEALSLYRRMLEQIRKAPFTASGELAKRLTEEMSRVEAARDGADAARAYQTEVALKNIEAKPALGGGQGMFGQMVNAGNRFLDEVQLTVSYYSDAGKLVYAEKHMPVAVPLEFSGFDRPILPFSPGQTREIGMKLNAPVEIQEQNKPKMTVSGIILSQPLPGPKLTASKAASAAEPKPAGSAPAAAVPDAKRN